LTYVTSKHHTFAFSREFVRQFANRRGFAPTIHTHHHQHRRFLNLLKKCHVSYLSMISCTNLPIDVALPSHFTPPLTPTISVNVFFSLNLCSNGICALKCQSTWFCLQFTPTIMGWLRLVGSLI